MPQFVYVAMGKPAKSTVKDSPSYGKVPIPEVQHRGLLALRVDASGPGLDVVEATDFGNANWVESHPSNGHVYCSWDDKIRAFAVSGDGKLKPVNTVDSIGGVNHMTVSPDGAWLLTAGYTSATLTVFPISADGSLGPATDSKHHQAPMIERLADRQEQCHPHQIIFPPFSPGWTLTCDLGADCIWIYGFNSTSGSLFGSINSDRHVKFPEGSGPRHAACHPSGKWVFVLCELDGQVVTCDWDGASGRLTPKSSAGMLPEGMCGSRAHHSGASAIRVSPDGSTVYASHRTDDTIVVFGVDGNGALQKRQAVSCAGVTPRDVQLEWPTGGDAAGSRFLRVGNQDTQSIATFAVQPDGLLAEPPTLFATPGSCPTCISRPTSSLLGGAGLKRSCPF